MDHFSTVLQRPAHFDEDGSNGGAGTGDDRAPPRGGLRDILNPVSSMSQTSPVLRGPSVPAPAPAPSSLSSIAAPASSRSHPSSLNLRSPTTQLTDYHHTSPYSASPPSTSIASIGGAREPSGPRSILNNPFDSASTHSLLPPQPSALHAPPLPPAASPRTTTATLGSPSPALHAPSLFYPPSADVRDRDRDHHHHHREKSTGNGFYDPTSDTTPSASANKERERGVSDTGSSWRNATQVSTPKANKRWPIRDSRNFLCARLSVFPLSSTELLSTENHTHRLIPLQSTNSISARSSLLGS
ncbi:hypothetical protein V8F33_002447 [Rhypophila sp. PSN 637]